MESAPGIYGNGDENTEYAYRPGGFGSGSAEDVEVVAEYGGGLDAADGTWRVVELGDGQVSDCPPTTDLAAFLNAVLRP